MTKQLQDMTKRKPNMTAKTGEVNHKPTTCANDKCSLAVGNHSNTMEYEDKAAIGGTEVNIPNYGDVTLDDEGRALLPYNFLPTLVDQLPDEWYYGTYPWFKYFDQAQRDAAGKQVIATQGLSTASPENVEKWKLLV